jgi:glyoxylase-like metal-dependent hydrolase (beta-lactamase superfamily II)
MAASRLSAHLAGGGQRLPHVPPRQRLSSRVFGVLGMNPNPFSLTGTNCYLIGTGKRRMLLDTGQGEPAFMPNMAEAMKEAGCDGLDQIVISHWHHDHLGGLPDVTKLWPDVPVRKYMPAKMDALTAGEGAIDPYSIWPADRFTPLADGEILRTEGATLEVMFTPGHACDHVALLLQEEGAMFTGDNVLGVGTAVVSDLPLYLASLQRMAAAGPERLYTAHGPLVESGGVAKIEEYIAHRRKRIEEVRALVVAAGAADVLTAADVARQMYPGLAAQLVGAAQNNTRLALELLQHEGVLAPCAAPAGGRAWRRAAAMAAAPSAL